jgi:hypothetical protein
MHMLRYYSILAVAAYEVVACEVAVVHSSGVGHTPKRWTIPWWLSQRMVCDNAR